MIILQSDIWLSRLRKAFNCDYFRDGSKETIKEKEKLILEYSAGILKTENIDNCFQKYLVGTFGN